MNLVSIQGVHAPIMQFTENELAICSRLMQSLSGHRFMVVSSRFRTDILYESDVPRNHSIIRLWCMYKNLPYNETITNRFFRSEGTLESMQHFFLRLIHLQQMNKWYESYMQELIHTTTHSIAPFAMQLHECLEIMLEKNYLSRVEHDKDAKPVPYENIKSIVEATILKYHLN